MEAIMSIIETGIAVFLGAAGVCVIVCAIHGHAAVDPAQRRSLKLSLGNQCPQRRNSSGRAIVSSSTGTFFKTGAIDRRGRTSTDATIRREHRRQAGEHP